MDEQTEAGNSIKADEQIRMRWETGTDILKGVFKRLVFGLSESSKSKHVVKGEATVDVLGMCIYASPLSVWSTNC